MSLSYFDPQDPAFAALIGMFVDELPERVASIESAVASGDTDTLRRIGHQLKGSAASYGFDELTRPAFALQSACDESAGSDAIKEAAMSLAQACRDAVAAHTKQVAAAES